MPIRRSKPQRQRLASAKAETPAKIAEHEKIAKEAASLVAALSTITAPTSGPATKLVTNDEKVAAAQKKLDDLNAELVKRREFRAKQTEGSAELEKARAAVQEIKPKIAEAEAELAAAQTIAPTVVQVPAGTKQHPLVEAVANARAAADQAKTQITAARTDVERWNRAQAFMTVHRAELSYSELKAKHEELVATAKDALRPVEMAQQQIADLEKATVEGPSKLKEAEEAVAQAQQNRESATKTIAAAEAMIAEKQKAADQSKTVRGRDCCSDEEGYGAQCRNRAATPRSRKASGRHSGICQGK
jgi:DNA repair exonuclease SbcCD ATPase subunit